MADLQGLCQVINTTHGPPIAPAHLACVLGQILASPPEIKRSLAERTKRHDDVHDSIAWAIFEHVSDTQCVKEKTSQMSIKSGYIIAISSLCTIICCLLLHLLSGSRHFLVSLIWTTAVSGFGAELGREGGREEGRGLDWEAHLFPTLPIPFLIL
jgi:hypothetical protein